MLKKHKLDYRCMWTLLVFLTFMVRQDSSERYKISDFLAQFAHTSRIFQVFRTRFCFKKVIVSEKLKPTLTVLDNQVSEARNKNEVFLLFRKKILRIRFDGKIKHLVFEKNVFDTRVISERISHLGFSYYPNSDPRNPIDCFFNLSNPNRREKL